MKPLVKVFWMLCIIIFSMPLFAAATMSSDPKATSYIERSEQQTMGDSLQATLDMAIKRGQAERNLKFKLWLWKRETALVKIFEPLKDRDSGSLKIDQNLWQYLPNVLRVVRIPPSMMLQSWMGSDFTNDDMIKTSSLLRDYFHQLDGQDHIGDVPVIKVVCLPKPNAPVVWGKVRVWLRPKDSVSLRQEFFSEHGELIKIMEGSDIKTFGKHTMATTLLMTVVKKPGFSTTMHFENAEFDQPIEKSVFTQENLTRPSRSDSRDNNRDNSRDNNGDNK